MDFAVVLAGTHYPAIRERLALRIHQSKTGRHRAEFILGEFGIVAH